MNHSTSLPLAADLHCSLAADGFALVGQVNLPERAARHAAVPSSLASPVRSRLAVAYPQGLYAHQSMALDLNRQSRDVCLATPPPPARASCS